MGERARRKLVLGSEAYAVGGGPPEFDALVVAKWPDFDSHSLMDSFIPIL